MIARALPVLTTPSVLTVTMVTNACARLDSRAYDVRTRRMNALLVLVFMENALTWKTTIAVSATWRTTVQIVAKSSDPLLIVVTKTTTVHTAPRVSPKAMQPSVFVYLDTRVTCVKWISKIAIIRRVWILGGVWTVSIRFNVSVVMVSGDHVAKLTSTSVTRIPVIQTRPVKTCLGTTAAIVRPVLPACTAITILIIARQGTHVKMVDPVWTAQPTILVGAGKNPLMKLRSYLAVTL
jgi:hypothetical protein